MTDTTGAGIILTQLGGRMFQMMTGAKNLIAGDKPVSLSFKLGSGMEIKDKITHVRIVLNANDLYDVTFLRIRGTNVKTVATESNVFAEDLQKIFKTRTGLDTKL